MEKVIRFLKEEEGVTAIEYALIAAVITVGVVGGYSLIRDWIIENIEPVAAITPNP